MWLIISFLTYQTLDEGRKRACEFHHLNCWTPSQGCFITTVSSGLEVKL